MLPPKEQFLREETVRGGMDLLLFVNSRHLKRADEKLATLGLGRAHHRVLYFLARRADLSVSELLALLDITKQSFGRVAKDLTAKGLTEQRAGERDRRQRLLRLTPAGEALERAGIGATRIGLILPRRPDAERRTRRGGSKRSARTCEAVLLTPADFIFA